MISATYNLSLDYKATGDYESAFDYLSVYKVLIDEQQYLEKLQLSINSRVAEETDKEIRLKEEANASRDRFIQLTIAIGVVSIFILFLLVLVAKERKKSEKLLLNILPKKIADKLKKYGKAESERYTDVTVYFSDIVGFTDTSATMEPDFLISELNDIFTMFDNIMEANGCERIKTIGDAYLAVCGMPNAFEDHALRMTSAALAIRDALKERNEKSDIQWRIRIGLHTGSVVGGIVGIKKYIYDVFGDTINTASRMESNSEPMKINITPDVYNLIDDKFTFEKRELIDIKGKGQMQMYFVEAKV
jgi:class 3 adenylate cyclase